MWSDFHFLTPYWLLLLLVLPLILWLLLNRTSSAWQQWIDPVLAPFVLTGKDGRSSTTLRLWLAGLAWVLAVVALAGPTWVKRNVPVYNNPHSLVIGLDLSASMWSKDVDPNRLSRARFKLLDILAKRKDGQTALIVFAGDAFVVTPLTTDSVTISEQLKVLAPDIMPATGSRLAPPIVEANKLFKQAQVKEGDILLITDGVDDTPQAQAAADLAARAGYVVSTLSIGTEKGAPIALPSGDSLRDVEGNVILPKVNQEDISSVSNAGQGLSLSASVDDSDLTQLQALWEQHISTLSPQLQEEKLELWVNQGYWLLVPLIPLVLSVFRRGWLVVLLALMLSAKPEPVLALEWESLWKTPDQQGQQAMQSKQFNKAQEQFNNPEWKATAAYEAGNFPEAAKFYKDQLSPEGQYNYGNALAKQGQLQDAIQAYDRALATKPDYEVAKKNRAMVEQALKQQQQQQAQQNQQQQQQNQDQQKDGQQGGQSQPNQNSANQGKQSQQKGSQNPNPSDAQGKSEQNAGNPSDTKADQSEKSAADAKKQQDAERKKAAERQKAQAANAENPEGAPAEAEPDTPQSREQEQATEQWLRRIPDDPSELWRRKFYYQYQQRTPQQQGVAW